MITQAFSFFPDGLGSGCDGRLLDRRSRSSLIHVKTALRILMPFFAEASTKGALNSLASAWPSIVETSRSVTLSLFIPTKTVEVELLHTLSHMAGASCVPDLTRSIWLKN